MKEFEKNAFPQTHQEHEELIEKLWNAFYEHLTTDERFANVDEKIELHCKFYKKLPSHLKPEFRDIICNLEENYEKHENILINFIASYILQNYREK